MILSLMLIGDKNRINNEKAKQNKISTIVSDIVSIKKALAARRRLQSIAIRRHKNTGIILRAHKRSSKNSSQTVAREKIFALNFVKIQTCHST